MGHLHRLLLQNVLRGQLPSDLAAQRLFLPQTLSIKRRLPLSAAAHGAKGKGKGKGKGSELRRIVNMGERYGGSTQKKSVGWQEREPTFPCSARMSLSATFCQHETCI